MNDKNKGPSKLIMKIAPIARDIVGVLAKAEEDGAIGLDESAAIIGVLEGILAARVERSVASTLDRMPPVLRSFIEQAGGPVALVMPALERASREGFDFGHTMDSMADAFAKAGVSLDDSAFTDEAKAKAKAAADDVLARIMKGGDA